MPWMCLCRFSQVGVGLLEDQARNWSLGYLYAFYLHTVERWRFKRVAEVGQGLTAKTKNSKSSLLPHEVGSDVDCATLCRVGRLDCCCELQAAGQSYIVTDDGHHCTVKEDWRGRAGSQRSFNTSAPSSEGRGVRLPFVVFLCVCQCAQKVTASNCCGQCV